MKIVFLGTGTSTGNPEIGCQCEVCTSKDPRDWRLRASILVETEGKRILIDCGPDFRWQMITNKIYYFDKNGYMKTGWIDWEGKSYYCSENGDMLTNCMTPDNYLVGEDGAWIAQ